jgi:hypothetical protein
MLRSHDGDDDADDDDDDAADKRSWWRRGGGGGGGGAEIARARGYDKWGEVEEGEEDYWDGMGWMHLRGGEGT